MDRRRPARRPPAVQRRMDLREGRRTENPGPAHDWGVEGTFKQEYPGESGKLAWWGKASYTKTLELTAEDLQKDIDLEIDGAMSHATVTVNGMDLGGWPYGYASFAIRLNPALKPGANEIRVDIDNTEESSRWYPGGGIYRNVWLTKTEKSSVAHWGTYVTTDIKNVRKLEKSTFWFAENSPSKKFTADAEVRLTSPSSMPESRWWA